MGRIGFGLKRNARRIQAAGGAPTPAPAPSDALVMTRDVWAFGASSMQGGQQAASPVGGTEDSLTDVVRKVLGLPAGSTSYTAVSGSLTTRPIDYILTGASAGHWVRNRGVSGSTSGAAGGIVTAMTAAAGGFGASDLLFLHQGDNGLSGSNAADAETLIDGFEAMKTSAGTRPYCLIVNTRGTSEPTGAYWGLLKEIVWRELQDHYPGKVFSLHHTLLGHATAADANDTADLGNGMPPRSYLMNDGSHQIAKGYDLQSQMVTLPVVDAVEGGTPFPLKQTVIAATPSSPAAGDVIGSVAAYGIGGSFALDSANVQTDYAMAAGGQITRIGATPPTRDMTRMAVKTSKSGRFDKMQPQIWVCERAAPGVSKLVEFDGKSMLGMPNSQLASVSRLTVLFRVQAVDQSAIQNVMGATNQCLIRLLTGGTLDVVWRNAGGAVIFSKTTGALFRTSDAARWVAICMDLSNPGAEVTKLVHWNDPASATADTAVHTNLTADGSTAHLARLNTGLAIAAATIGNSVGATFSKLRLGDFYVFNDYLDFAVQARREEVCNAGSTPKSAWLTGGGVTSGITPLLGLSGNAGDWRQCRLVGSAVPSGFGAPGQRMGFGAQKRSDGEFGYLMTVP